MAVFAPAPVPAADPPAGTEPWRYDGGRVQIDLAARRLVVDGQTAAVGSRGFGLLAELARADGGVRGKADLLASVWPGVVVEENNLHVQVKALRRLLGAGAIASVHGRGYALALRRDAVPAQHLFGRDALLAAAAALLAVASTRLLTLHGPGGVGKTRVARAVFEQQPAWPDGHFFVPLEALTDAGEFAAALSRALGLRPDSAMAPMPLLCSHLRDRHVLLVLDNAEHLRDLPPLLLALLDAAPGLKLLVTSRIRLGLAAEVLLEVAPLPVATAAAAVATADSAPSAALALFMQRALECGHPVQLAERATALRICGRLDGLPLALELAAARLRAMSVATLEGELARSLRAVGAGQDVPASRHRSLHDTLSWSVGLLSPGAQRLLNRLSVFRGGFDLSAGQAVCSDDAAADDRATWLDRLTELIESHLVRRHDDPAGLTRYTMLETVREFAAEALAASGEADAVTARHAAWCMQLAAQHDRALRSAARPAALAALQADSGNLRAALQHLVQTRRDALAASRLCADLAWWWYFSGSMTEGRLWQDAALALRLPEDATPEAAAALRHQRARNLAGACKLHFYLGDSESALAVGLESVALARMGNEPEALAYALYHLALPMRRRSAADCLALHDEARAVFQALGDRWGEALVVSYGGIPLAFDAARHAEASRRLSDGQALFEQIGDGWGSTIADQYLSVMALRHGDLAQARLRAQRVHDVAMALDDGFRRASALHQLARVAIAEGRWLEAESTLLRAVRLNADQGRLGYAGKLLRQSARLLARRGQVRLAARVFGAAAVDHGPMQMPLVLVEEDEACDAAFEATRERLGRRLFEQCEAEGATWSLAQTIERLVRAVSGPGS